MTCLAFWADTRPKSSGGSELGDQVADLRLRLAALSVRERDLRRLVFDRFHDLDHPRQLGFAGLGVDLTANVVLAAVARLRCLLDSVFHRRDHDLAVD